MWNASFLKAVLLILLDPDPEICPTLDLVPDPRRFTGLHYQCLIEKQLLK